MIIYENECCGCAAPGYPCIGEDCSLLRVPHLYCDRCRCEVDELYNVDGEQVCDDCLHEMFEMITADAV